MRLDKFIASNTEWSRKDVKIAARKGKIAINNQPIKDLSYHLADTDEVFFDGELIEALPPFYLMMNKPEHTVCATKDSLNPTVIDVLSEMAYQKNCSWILNKPSIVEELQIVGRLDIDTTGLLLITNDGQWNHRVTSPNAACPKAYRATIAEPISENAIQQLEKGVLLKDAKQATRPARVEIINEQTILLTISEGKYHQVKRMLAAVGNHVLELHRLAIGPLTLDGDLDFGDFRHLTSEEIHYF